MLYPHIRTFLSLAMLVCAVPLAAQPGAEPVLEAMDAYMGHWQSDTNLDQGGNEFHFEYTLEWMDADHTIATMLIERVDAGGSRTQIFEGFKGREPSGQSVYYFAASASGRAARGEVILDKDQLVTSYEGWSVDGTVVQIRDVFYPVEGETFVSKTWLRASSEEEWRQVGDDQWSRI